MQTIDWRQHLRHDGTLAVDANLYASQLSHERFAEQRIKDAVVDQLRDAAGVRPSVDIERPDLRINLSLRRDRATLSLDLSGASLHRRGWRREQGDAPLKETLACAVLIRAGWPEVFANGGSLLDPMCGSGTLRSKARALLQTIAPGLQREYFVLRWVVRPARERASRRRTQPRSAGWRRSVAFLLIRHRPQSIATTTPAEGRLRPLGTPNSARVDLALARGTRNWPGGLHPLTTSVGQTRNSRHWRRPEAQLLRRPRRC